jgi:predicted kinase
MGVRFAILHLEARPETLRERVRLRALRRDDASEADLAVLESQLANAQPLHDDEQAVVVRVDAEQLLDELVAPGAWFPLLERLGLSTA